MRLVVFIAAVILWSACEKPNTAAPSFNGQWQLEIVMYAEGEEIAKMNGNIVFLADHTAKLVIVNGEHLEETNFIWSQQNEHLLLVNETSGFVIPYRINVFTHAAADLSQNGDVKMHLLR